MKIRAFACGESLCKKAFDAEISTDKPWPMKCPACGRSLYPEDILQSTVLDSLDRHRGPLMKVVDGKLIPILSSELRGESVRAPVSLLDEIADATQAKASKKSNSRIFVAAAAVIVLVVIWTVVRSL